MIAAAVDTDDIEIVNIRNPSQRRISSQEKTKSCIPKDRINTRLKGWRKCCIFGILFFLSFIVMLNLALTSWILSTMKFNKDGMGHLKITNDGILVTGSAIFLDELISSTIKSRQYEPLSMETYGNFTIAIRDEEGTFTNAMYLDENKFECQGNEFVVKDRDEKVLFSANSDQVLIGAENLKISGEGGVIFDKSLNTPLVRSETGKDLRLESLTRSLNIEAAEKISVESKAGSIDAFTLNDLNLRSSRGSIRIDSPTIIVKQLQKAISEDVFSFKSRTKTTTKKSNIFQLCICGNGRLFLANANGICETSDTDLICA